MSNEGYKLMMDPTSYILNGSGFCSLPSVPFTLFAAIAKHAMPKSVSATS